MFLLIQSSSIFDGSTNWTFFDSAICFNWSYACGKVNTSSSIVHWTKFIFRQSHSFIFIKAIVCAKVDANSQRSKQKALWCKYFGQSFFWIPRFLCVALTVAWLDGSLSASTKIRTCMGPNFWARPGLNSQIKARRKSKTKARPRPSPWAHFNFFTS